MLSYSLWMDVKVDVSIPGAGRRIPAVAPLKLLGSFTRQTMDSWSRLRACRKRRISDYRHYTPERCIDMFRYTTDGLRSHSAGDHRGLNAADIDIGKGPVTREIEVFEHGIARREAILCRARQAQNITFRGINVGAEELRVECVLFTRAIHQQAPIEFSALIGRSWPECA